MGWTDSLSPSIRIDCRHRRVFGYRLNELAGSQVRPYVSPERASLCRHSQPAPPPPDSPPTNGTKTRSAGAEASGAEVTDPQVLTLTRGRSYRRGGSLDGRRDGGTPAALPLHLVDLAFAVVLATSLKGEHFRILGEPLQRSQQVTYGHIRRVATVAR